jgi:hypothetical protein
MKKLLLSLVLLLAITLSAKTTDTTVSSDYCDGWDEGYCEGWKDVKGSLAICPVTPVCPVAQVGRSSYRDGYNRGFKSGRAKAQD